MKPNIFRSTYRELSQAEKLRIAQIKDAAVKLYELIDPGFVFDAVPATDEQPALEARQVDARQMALARTNLEQSVMWATKAITG